MNENRLAIILREIEPDQTAQIDLLVKANEPTDTPTPPWQLVHIVRVRNFGALNVFNQNYVYHHTDLATAITEIKNHTGATHDLFINAQDWEAIINGDIESRRAEALANLQLQPVNITDLIFEDGKFSTIELTLKR